MRVASFAVSGPNGQSLDVSISALEGDGGDLQNVNRWRGQIGLPEISEAEMKALIVPVKAKDGDMSTVNMGGPKARILAGWTKHNGLCWFFKMTGPDALADAEKQHFAEFLQSVEF